MLSVVMLNVANKPILLSFVMLSVVNLNVVAPIKRCGRVLCTKTFSIDIDVQSLPDSLIFAGKA